MTNYTLTVLNALPRVTDLSIVVGLC
jgi:hypothetical protein